MPDISDDKLREILRETQVIVMVGASTNPSRPSNQVGHYLRDRGYRVIPVNPGHAGEALFGETVRASLDDLGPEEAGEVDMLEIFRRSEAVPEIVRAGLEAMPGLGTVWMQIGVISEPAREMAEARGVQVVMDRCPRIELDRLVG